MAGGGVDDSSFGLGFAAGVLSVVVILPASTWLLLRFVPQARERLVSKVASVIDNSLVNALREVPPDVRVIAEGSVLSLFRVATGKTWQEFAREKLSIPVGNVVLTKLNIPAVSIEDLSR